MNFGMGAMKNCALSPQLGLPVAAEQLLVDGKYHIIGDLQTAPRQAFTKVLKDCASILEATVATVVVLITPLPRYVRKGCCENPDHVSNIENSDYEEELQLAVSHFRAADVSLSAANSRWVLARTITPPGT